MMKVLLVLFAFSAVATSAPSTPSTVYSYGGAAFVGSRTGAGGTVSGGYASKSVIERTVIPQYVEQRIQVPTYVEKTIRVPTYVEKTVKVPAPPRIVERQISHEEVPVEHHAVSAASPYGDVGVYKVVSAGGSAYGRRPAGFSFAAGAFGPGLYNSLVNLKIQKLRAVNSVLNGIARGLTGGVSFYAGKTYSPYY